VRADAALSAAFYARRQHVSKRELVFDLVDSLHVANNLQRPEVNEGVRALRPPPNVASLRVCDPAGEDRVEPKIDQVRA